MTQQDITKIYLVEKKRILKSNFKPAVRIAKLRAIELIYKAFKEHQGLV